MKIEAGVAAMRGGQVWGEVWDDGNGPIYGWTDDLDKVKICDPEYCTKPAEMEGRREDFSAGNQWLFTDRSSEFAGAVLVPVERRTEVVIIKTGEE
jgi:hypothetical protein